jgi:predicted nucleic acid-binding protein
MIALKLIGEALEKANGIISFQVIQEFLNVSTRKFEKPLSISDCQRYLNFVLEPLCEVFTSIELYNQALEIVESWKYSFYDSLIIASALKAECKYLYTEDLHHTQTIKHLTILNPFHV